MTGAPLKVLHVIDTLGMGGAETWLLEVLRIWSRTGLGQMDFIATSGNVGIFDAEAQKLGARIAYIRFGRGELPKFVRDFRHVLRTGRYHAIHDHQDYASGWHFLSGGALLPAIRVTHVHNPAYQIRNNYGVSLARRITAAIGKGLVARYATHITGTSRQVITEYGFDAPRFERITKTALHCGFDPTRFTGDVDASRSSVRGEFGWYEDATLILFAGRIDQSADVNHPQNHKNSGFAVSVAIECMRRDAKMRFLFVGAPSPAVPILDARIAAAGFSGSIVFAGVRSDIARLMMASDALLFPSRGEGLGMVAVEAQAAGLRILASTAVPRECVVVPELVRFKRLEDGDVAWATALLQFARKGRNRADANQRVARSAFSIEQSTHALLKLYRDTALR